MCTRLTFLILLIYIFYIAFPAQGPVRGFRRERQTDILVNVHSPVRQLFAVRPRPVLRMGQTDKDL